MARPEVSIYAPDPIVVGREVSIDIHVTAARETKIEHITARLEGEQGWAVGSGKSRISARVTFPSLAQQLMGPGVLPAATTTRLVARFTLPPSTPPTHEVSPAWSRMKLFVHVSIPWAIDGRYKYELAVRIPAPDVERTPVLVRNTEEPDKPRIELGLASSRLIAGEELVGTCAVFHLDDDKPREVSLSLVPSLSLYGRGRARERRGGTIVSTLTMPAGSAGTGLPFRLALPATITPTFAAASHALRWFLVAHTGRFLGASVEIAVPIEIVDRSATARTPRLEAAPRVGDERIASVFAKFATTQGWHGGEPGADDFAIEKDVGDIVARIAYAYRGEAGTVVVASVHSPSLGLGLDVSPSSSLRHMFWKDVEVDIAAWDRAHLVKARYPAQAIPFLFGVVPTLMRGASLGPMVRWSDTEVVFERQIAAVEESEIALVAAYLELIAVTIANNLHAISAPPSVTVDLDAWRGLAASLGGTLALGDLGITGKLSGAAVDLGLEFADARPVRVHIAVGDPEAASEEIKKIVIRLPRPARDVLGVNAAERLVSLISTWPEDIVNLEVENGVVTAALLLPGGEAPAVDAGRVREVVGQLRAVLGALLPDAAPYR